MPQVITVNYYSMNHYKSMILCSVFSHLYIFDNIAQNDYERSIRIQTTSPKENLVGFQALEYHTVVTLCYSGTIEFYNYKEREKYGVLNILK